MFNDYKNLLCLRARKPTMFNDVVLANDVSS